MKIGIISDTHTKLTKTEKVLNLLLKNGAEFIIHAGDIEMYETLQLLQNCGKRYVVVYGNNDSHLLEYHDEFNLVQEPSYFKLADLKFKLMHMPYYMSADADIIISGHTHIFHSELKNNTLYLNPGEVCARKKPISECAMLEIKDKCFIVTHYTRENKTEYFNEKIYNYER